MRPYSILMWIDKYSEFVSLAFLQNMDNIIQVSRIIDTTTKGKTKGYKHTYGIRQLSWSRTGLRAR